MWVILGLIMFSLCFQKCCTSIPQKNTSYVHSFPCGEHRCFAIKSMMITCCQNNGQIGCCNDYNNNKIEYIHKTIPDVVDTKSTDRLSTVSFGIGATIGVIIGFVMLFIGCAVAFHYCCLNPIPSGYQYPTIAYRQSGLRGRNSHVLSIPLDPDRHNSHVDISINLRFHSAQEVEAFDEPPKYEDVPKVSVPLHAANQTLTSQELPSYSSVVGNQGMS